MAALILERRFSPRNFPNPNLLTNQKITASQTDIFPQVFLSLSLSPFLFFFLIFIQGQTKPNQARETTAQDSTGWTRGGPHLPVTADLPLSSRLFQAARREESISLT